MNRIAQLQAGIAAKSKALEDLLNLRETDSREFTPEEKAQWKSLMEETAALKADLQLEQEAEEVRKQKALDKAGQKTPEQKAQQAFSFHRGLRALYNQKRLTGIEAEMSQEAEKEWRDAGTPHTAEGLAIPSFLVNMKGKNVIHGHQMRALTAGGAAEGQELVNEEYKGHIYGLNINPLVAQLGATVLMGLTGTPKFTKSGTLTMVWEGENDANAAGSPSTGEITLSPKRGGLYVDISKMLMAQAPGIAEEITRRELSMGASVGLDAAAINGSGSAPGGILSYTNLNVISGGLGTHGAPVTRANLLTLRKLIQEDNAVLSDMAWLTTPGIENYLMDLPIDAGSGRFVWNEDSNKVIGSPAFSSNNVPSNLTKGDSTDCHAIILACWNQLMIGQWGGIDFVIDPITLATTGYLRIVMNGYWDIKPRHEQAFAAIKDAKLS